MMDLVQSMIKFSFIVFYDAFFNISQHSYHDVDNDVASIDSRQNSMDDDDNHNDDND